MTTTDTQAYCASASHGQTSLIREVLIGIVSLYDAQRLRIDVTGRAKVEAPVQFAAASIRVELSRLGEV